MMPLKIKFPTLSSLIKKDLTKGYFLPYLSSTYCPESKFYDDKKYRVFDCPPDSLQYMDFLYPIRLLSVFGDEIPVLIDRHPPLYLKQHWKTWLPTFPQADLRNVDEGFKCDAPIVTNAAIQRIPVEQHSVHPEVLYKLHRKSTVLEIGVPCPRHMTEDAVTFPCLVKVDLSYGGLGNRAAKCKGELSRVLSEIRVKYGWDAPILFQELVSGVIDVPSIVFYLHKSGEISWIGTSIGGFDNFSFTSAVVDWNRQQEYKDLLHDQFTVPLCNYLHKEGYFGLVNYEVLRTDHGMYFVDLNPRQSADTSHLISAPYMAELGYSYSILDQRHLVVNVSAKALVERANEINRKSDGGKIIIPAIGEVDEMSCKAAFSVYGKSLDEAKALFKQLLELY